MNFFELMSSDKAKRKNNKLLAILASIWSHPGISRYDLAKKLNVSRVAATKNIEQLLEWGMIEEDHDSGRRSIPLALKKELFYSIGILCHLDYTEVVLVNAAQEKMDSCLTDSCFDDWQEKCDWLVATCNQLIRKHNVSDDTITGVGLTLPGNIDLQSGLVVASPAFPQRYDMDIVGYIQTKMEVPVFMINLSHMLAYSEKKWGLAKEMQSFLSLHEGLGLGMFLNGQLYRGHKYSAGEFGFSQVPHNGEIGSDGRVGTLEIVAPFYKITDHLTELTAKKRYLGMTKYLKPGDSEVTLDMVIQAVEDGDQVCAQLMRNQFEVIGNAILNLVYIFSPEAVFLPAWTARCQFCTVDKVNDVIASYGIHGHRLATKVLSAAIDDSMLAQAAGAIPVEECFNINRIEGE